MTDEGKRTFPLYQVDAIGNTQPDKMKRNKFLYYLTICDRTGSLALIRHGTSFIAINTTFGLVPRHLPLGGRLQNGINFLPSFNDERTFFDKLKRPVFFRAFLLDEKNIN